MIWCLSTTVVKARNIALANLELSIDEMGTHPDMTSLITLAIGTGEPPNCNAEVPDLDLREVMITQTDIGWNLLQFAFVAEA